MKLITALKLIDPEKENLHAVTEEEKNELQKELLEMMKDVAAICEENHIQWSLSGGSVLGAVRHHGFIPWDDDMDINMTRRDFNRFRRVFPGRLSDKYVLKVPGDSGYLTHAPTIYKKGTTFMGLMPTDRREHGIFIDIFIMENVYNNPVLYYAHGLLCTAVHLLQSLVRADQCKSVLLKYTHHYPEIQRTINIRAIPGKILGFLPMEFWGRLVFQTFSKCRNHRSKRVSIPSGFHHYFGETYDRKKVCKYVKCQFETELFPIPVDYDYYLRKLYGDTYMTPPPESERMKHVVIKFDLKS